MRGILLKTYRLQPNWMIAFLIGLGILLRLRQYLANRSLWFDEAMLTLNILERDFAGLLRPLDYGQGAPPGFLFLEKASVEILGNSEYVLRLAPFLASVLSLVGFYYLAKRSLHPPIVPIAVGLFAVIGSLITYSAQAKQYSSDVLVTVILTSLALVFSEEGWTWPNVVSFTVVGAVSIWFSHPAIFVLASIAACLLASSFSSRNWDRLKKLILMSVFLGASFVTLYVVSVRDLSTHQRLLNIWEATFAPLFPISVSNYRWYFEAFFDVFASSMRFYLPGIAALAFLVGCSVCYRRAGQRLCIFLSPLLFALVASMLHRYPFQGRFLLFATPLLVLLIAEGAYFVWEKTQPAAPIIGRLLLVLLFLPSVLVAVTDAVSPKGQEEMREALTYLDVHWSEGDVLYVHHAAAPTFRYYIERDSFRITNYVYGALTQNDYYKCMEDLQTLCGDARVWVLLSHVNRNDGIDEGQLVLQCLDRLGMQKDIFAERGVVLYLYDLSTCAN